MMAVNPLSDEKQKSQQSVENSMSEIEVYA